MFAFCSIGLLHFLFEPFCKL